MIAQTMIVARARSEGSDRLVAADGPLAPLQRACGGALPGTIAIPALLELTRKAWRLGTPLARAIAAQDGEQAITAWTEVVPDESGCAIAMSNWRVAALDESQLGVAAAIPASDEAALLAQTADLTARLDARQVPLAVGRAETVLQPLAEALRTHRGHPWTDFVKLPGASHRQPLHWRLLDRAVVEVPEVEGRWLARLVPGAGMLEVAGFDLYLVPTAVAGIPDFDDEAAAAPSPVALEGLLGRDLATALRQPINRMIANAETIRARLAGPLTEEYAGYAGDIAEAGRHLLGLVEDLADLEAVEQPGFATERDRIDLADAACRAAGILAIRAQERGITVEAPDRGITLPAVGEFRRVLQILLNLLGNAIRYAPANSTVRIVVEDRGERAAVTVADEGKGLSLAQQVKVFDKFERLGRRGDGGSGLGLYISRRLARAMGGELSVAGAPGEGARFTLELPSS